MKVFMDIAPEVAGALADGRPVVALESTLISHGLPHPHNVETARAAEAAVRDEGAVPATIGMIAGRAVIGLDARQIARLAEGGAAVLKLSRRDLAWAAAEKRDGGTTVAATMICAHAAGIRLFATGGIGGVHRGAAETFDVSADLTELSRTPVAVVCAGAKAILDLPKTLEALETLGVPVVGYGTRSFPAFYCQESGLGLDYSVADPEAAARFLQAHFAMGLGGGALIAQPVRAAVAVDPGVVEAALADALAAAEAEGVAGKALTPFLLGRVAEATGGAALAANTALIEDNARLAARIAVAMAGAGDG